MPANNQRHLDCYCKSEWALYHGDTFIDLGTMPYLHRATGKSMNSLNCLRSPIYKKRWSKTGKGLILIKIQ